MWNITNKFLGKLPSDFSLHESEDFLFLKYKEKVVAIFNRNAAKVEEIERAAKEYLQKGT